jgi:hypothetical protein
VLLAAGVKLASHPTETQRARRRCSC